MRYNVSAVATAVIDLGDVEADSREDAIEKAMENDVSNKSRRNDFYKFN